MSINIAESWMQWLKEEHSPDMVATGCFTQATILRLIEVDETQEPAYALQYHANNKALYIRYIETFAEEMRKKATGKWGDQFIAFRSVLQVVN